MEAVARFSFANFPAELKVTILEYFLEDATEVVRYSKPAADSKKRLAIHRQIRDGDGNVIDATTMLLLSKGFKNTVLPIFTKLPKVVEVSSEEEARKLHILLRKRRSPLLDQIIEAKFHMLPGVSGGACLGVVKNEFRQVNRVSLEHQKSMYICEKAMQDEATGAAYLVKSVEAHFSELEKIFTAASRENVVLVLSTPAFIWNSGRTERKYIECVFSNRQGTLTRFESRDSGERGRIGQFKPRAQKEIVLAGVRLRCVFGLA